MIEKQILKQLEKKAELLKRLEEIEAKEAKVLAWAKANNPYWVFNPSLSEIPMEGMELLRKYLKPEDIPVRLDSQEDVICSRANIIGAGGGNGSGKTTALVIRTLIEATGEVPESLKDRFPKDLLPDKFPRNLRLVGVSDSTLEDTIIPRLRYWCPKEFLLKGSWDESFSSKYRILSLYRNKKVIATIQLKTSQQDEETHQGVDLDFVGFDEEPTEAIYKENRNRFRVAKRMLMMFAFTPTKGLTWSKDMFLYQDNTDGDYVETFKLSAVMNPEAYEQNKFSSIDEQLRMYLNKPDLYNELKMRFLGDIVSLSGFVYAGYFEKHSHVIQPFFEFLSPDKKSDYLCLFGCDPHLVTASAGVWILMDREGNCYVDRCMFKQLDTQEFKDEFWKVVNENKYRMGWSVCDKSADSTIIAFGGRNIFMELKRGKNYIPGLRPSIKFEGSVKAGIDNLKLKMRKKQFSIVDRPENKDLIKSFLTLERDTYANEDVKGQKDRIAEGKHHLHAALRYIFQFPVNWYPEIDVVPQPQFYDTEVLY